jgi:HK97 family phage major capsid protein
MPGLLDRETLLRHAHLLISSEKFDHEANARANALMTLAERIAPHSNGLAGDPELRSFECSIRGLRYGDGTTVIKFERRDMGVSTPGAGGDFVPQGFRDLLEVALKAYDALFDRQVVTLWETKNGAPAKLPALDDTQSAATIIGEGQQSVVGDATLTAQQTSLASAPTWRSGLIKISQELLQDSAFPILDMLAAAFAVRLARGVGASLVSTLLSAALPGPTAIGSGASTGGSETGADSVGYQDLVALRKSVNPAYRAAQKVFWVMNDNSLGALDSILDKSGRPVIHPQYDANGRRLLLGYPVAICPSMPDIGPSATPIAFGALGYFIFRTVPEAMRVVPYTERYADYGQIALETRLRGNACLLSVGTDSPVKTLVNAG